MAIQQQFTFPSSPEPSAPLNMRIVKLTALTIPVFVLISVSAHQLFFVLLPMARTASISTSPNYIGYVPTLNPTKLTNSSSSAALPGIQLWHGRRCRGKWQTGPARNSGNGFPYAIVRDAVIDRRPKAKEILGEADRPGVVRVLLFVTAHLSARLTREGGEVKVDGESIVGEVEYVTHINPFVIPNNGKYHPGLKTRYGQFVSQWEVGLVLMPAIGQGVKEVWSGFEKDLEMRIGLDVIRYDEQIFRMEVEMGLGCVMGVEVPEVEDKGKICGEGARGAILFSGSSLYGVKKKESEYFREVGNFAARAFLGALKFDFVVMSVITDFSVADMEVKCGGDEKCWDMLEGKNKDLLRRVAEVAEEEMQNIGVPRELFSRVLLLPACRLGTDANGSEKDDPCRMSKRYGQYTSLMSSYAFLSTFYKWAASYDIDEYFAGTPSLISSSFKSSPAADVLDKVDGKLGGRGDIVFPWLVFRVLTMNNAMALSQEVVRGQYPRLKTQEGQSSDDCYGRRRNSVGKAAVRCDVGFGFTIHHPAISIPGRRMAQEQGKLLFRDMRTWHARLGSASTKCDYVPSE